MEVNEKDLIKYIKQKTNVSVNVIQIVLDAEIDYLKEKGIAD
ncbi:hypothetical protein [Gracilibacillus sp. YIM 98692]|nr:hypothetical protein [Gracilibacillus sp. YIM 98692]